MKKFISLALCLIMVLSMVACTNTEGPADTTPTPSEPTKAPTDNTTEAPADNTTEAPSDNTTEAPADVTTEEPTAEVTEAPETPSLEFNDLPADQQAALLAIMPTALPDGSAYEIACRTMSFDYNGEEDYVIGGNSQGSAKFVDVTEGAIFGQAIKMAAKADAKDDRAEIEVLPVPDVTIEGTRGVMFYVDFSNVQIATDATTGEAKKMCASVTINTNDYRAQGPEKATGSGIGYYYIGGQWVQTTNITSCRMQIPDNFAGWIYIPSSSYYSKSDSVALGETFPDIFVTNMRCYTDGYVYSADSYIIFDEIVFVK